jgi:hypothetical protein
VWTLTALPTKDLRSQGHNFSCSKVYFLRKMRYTQPSRTGATSSDKTPGKPRW